MIIMNGVLKSVRDCCRFTGSNFFSKVLHAVCWLYSIYFWCRINVILTFPVVKANGRTDIYHEYSSELFSYNFTFLHVEPEASTASTTYGIWQGGSHNFSYAHSMWLPLSAIWSINMLTIVKCHVHHPSNTCYTWAFYVKSSLIWLVMVKGQILPTTQLISAHKFLPQG